MADPVVPMATATRGGLTDQRLAALRALMRARGLEAYLVPSADPHQSEYVPACWQRRRWLTGFSGSAGDVVVTLKQAGLWTDGRYHEQAEQELGGSSVELWRQGQPGVPTLHQWLAKTLRPGQTLGADARVLAKRASDELATALGSAGARLALRAGHLVDALWRDQPARPASPVVHHPLRFTGEPVPQKLLRLRARLRERRATAHVLGALDAIAWLFNLRATDVAHTPVAVAWAIVGERQAWLFCDPARLAVSAQRALSGAVELAPYDDFAPALRALASRRERVWIDPARASVWTLSKLRGCELVAERSPVALLQARKNPTELAGARQAQLRDGLALVRLLSWLGRVVGHRVVTELDVAETLARLRATSVYYRGESFAAIVAYAAHGSIVHYGATPASNATLAPRGLLLLDSGGQYLDGTTDVTRTVLLGGRATALQREHYTRVLKGHIALASCAFPRGTAGRQLEALARQALWQVGLDYAHGTGHGVGSFLSVHEGPQSLSARCSGVALEPGQLLSIEPGYYKPGHYGIRLENLVEVVEDPAGRPGFLAFQPLTLCPFDRRLIAPALLERAERRWLDGYHRGVRRALAPQLVPTDRAWLRAATAPLASAR
ncbi:MAG: aminopeptidase P family protein [Proteobacteria bacterium]|nr:aminopeptidase P family protein [Pseudomonadota bacterium]